MDRLWCLPLSQDSHSLKTSSSWDPAARHKSKQNQRNMSPSVIELLEEPEHAKSTQGALSPVQKKKVSLIRQQVEHLHIVKLAKKRRHYVMQFKGNARADEEFLLGVVVQIRKA